MLLGLLPALQARGCPVALACLNDANGRGAELGGAVAAHGITVHYAGLSGRLSVGGLLRLRSILRTTRPRLIHLHGYKATILAGVYGIVRRLPTVVTFHTHAMHDIHVSSTVVRIEGHILRRVHAIAAVSEPVREELEFRRGVSRQRLRVIPNGIPEPTGEASRDARDQTDGPTLLCVGRLIRKKNVQLLIEAVAQLRGSFPRFRLLVAGEGPMRESLERQVATLGLEGAVKFLGFVDDVASLLRQCDCFVLPSATEGMPISVLEAMSHGVPIVATRVGSIPAIAREEKEAVLVAPGDVAALATALERVLRNSELRRSLGDSARDRFVTEFTAARMAERYHHLYDSILTRSSS